MREEVILNLLGVKAGQVAQAPMVAHSDQCHNPINFKIFMVKGRTGPSINLQH